MKRDELLTKLAMNIEHWPDEHTPIAHGLPYLGPGIFWGVRGGAKGEEWCILEPHMITKDEYLEERNRLVLWQAIKPTAEDDANWHDFDDPVANAVQPAAIQMLEAAASHMREREATYDAPGGERSMAKTVAMFNVANGAEMTVEQGWQFMALLKIVRTTQGAYRADNYEDLAAYAALMGEAASEVGR